MEGIHDDGSGRYQMVESGCCGGEQSERWKHNLKREIKKRNLRRSTWTRHPRGVNTRIKIEELKLLPEIQFRGLAVRSPVRTTLKQMVAIQQRWKLFSC